MDFKVEVAWDEKAQVWVVRSSDVPGLVAETASLSGMHEKLKMRVPMLLEFNRHLLETKEDTPPRVQMVVAI